MEGNAEHPEYKHRYRERNEVGKSLRDIMRDLLRKLNGDIAAHKELVDIRNGKGYYECGEQPLRAHVVRSQPALHLINRNEQEADDRDDHDRNRVDLPQFRQLVVDIVREALGDSRYHEHREDTHGIAVGLPQRFTDVVRPFVVKNFRYTGHQDEQTGEQDDRDTTYKAITDGSEIWIVRDLFKERLHNFDKANKLFHL